MDRSRAIGQFAVDGSDRLFFQCFCRTFGTHSTWHQSERVVRAGLGSKGILEGALRELDDAFRHCAYQVGRIRSRAALRESAAHDGGDRAWEIRRLLRLP